MTPARLRTSAALLATLLAPPLSSAYAQVAYDAAGQHVEVLGLHTWTLRMLQDSIRRRVPGQTLEDAACQITLRDSLHFADALVNTLQWYDAPGAPMKKWLVIKVVEPREAARVRWAPAPADSFTSLLPAYASIVMPVTDSVGSFWIDRLMWPLQFVHRDSAERARAMEGGGPHGSEDALRLWAFLDAHRTEADRKLAMRTLRHDGFFANRVVAAMVLTNFGDRDSTWLALTEALRDPRESVRGAADLTLRDLPPHTVDWSRAVPTLRLLLGGTNLPAMQQVFENLARTKVAPSLAAPLLRGNGSWVMEHMRASYPGAMMTAHKLLVQLNGGRDLGVAARPWAAWVAAL